MVLTPDRERLKNLLIETVTLLCKNGLDFRNEFSVDALIGITLDQNDVFLVSIKETIKSGTVGDHTGGSGAAHDEVEERNSDVSLHSSYSVADFPADTPPRKSSNCQIDFDCTASVKNDDSGGKSTLASRRRQKANSSRQSFSEAISPSTSDNRIPDVSIASLPVGGEDYDRENVVPNETSHKDESKSESWKLSNEEPPRKRQRDTFCVPRKTGDGNASSQEAIHQDVITQCKSEPFEIIKLENSPINESEFSDQQEISNFHRNEGYGNETNTGLDAMFANWYGQDNLLNSSVVPSCSSWNNSALPTPSKNLQEQGHVWIENNCPTAETSKKDPSRDRNRPSVDWIASTTGPGERLPYKCSICNKQVKLLRDLRAHMTAKHNLEQGFECHVCGSMSTYKHNLLRHLRTVHGIRLDQCNAIF